MVAAAIKNDRKIAISQ